MEKSLKTAQLEKLREMLSSEYIPFLGGRPDREIPITSQEVMDLSIDLWTTASADQFLARIN